MSNDLEKFILKTPGLRFLITVPSKIKLPGLNGLSMYDLIKTYFIGLIEGTFSSRAGSIAFSFFMALFPFLLFLLNLLILRLGSALRTSTSDVYYLSTHSQNQNLKSN